MTRGHGCKRASALLQGAWWLVLEPAGHAETKGEATGLELACEGHLVPGQ